MRDAVTTYLLADTTLTDALTGGIHTGRELTRQTHPAAFDGNNEVKPCALVKVSGENPDGPDDIAGQQVLTIYLYAREQAVLDTAVARIYTLLQRHKFSGAWDCRHAGDVRDLEDQALNCDLVMSRYQITRYRG